MFAKEGYPTMAFATVVFVLVVYLTQTFVNHWFGYVIYAVVAILWGIVIYFFRDPERTPPEGEHLVISPADGKVVLIKKIEENIYLKQPATQISIFLSPLDVHVNRNPVSGLLEYVKYHPGKKLMAWNEHASELNERADFGVQHSSGTKIFFKQITGFLARRIVFHIKEGDQLQVGKRFGMMKFGSRMDVIVPDNVRVNVQEGERVWAGKTVIAEIG